MVGLKKVAPEELEQIIGKPALNVVHLKSDMFPACQLVSRLLSQLSTMPKYSEVVFTEVNAEDVQSFCITYKIMQVPTVLYFRNSKLVDRIDAYKPNEISDKISLHAKAIDMDEQAPVIVNKTTAPDNNTGTSISLEEKLKGIINREKVMLFMKGNPTTPRCGFSRKVVQILNDQNIQFGTFDILQDEEVRQGLKDYSNWQTYPQLYANGELVGGHDIIVEMSENGELVSACKGDS